MKLKDISHKIKKRYEPLGHCGYQFDFGDFVLCVESFYYSCSNDYDYFYKYAFKAERRSIDIKINGSANSKDIDNIKNFFKSFSKRDVAVNLVGAIFHGTYIKSVSFDFSSDDNNRFDIILVADYVS
jgi:hypothetical protein